MKNICVEGYWSCQGFIASGTACSDNTQACAYSGACDGAGSCAQTTFAKRLTSSALPGTTTAGGNNNVAVTAQYCNAGNWAADGSYAGVVSLATSDPQLATQSYGYSSADHGTHTFGVTYKTAGTQSLAIGDNLGTSTVQGTQSTSVQAGAPDHISIDVPMPTPVMTGSNTVTCCLPNGTRVLSTGYPIQAILRDAFANPTTSSHTFKVNTGDPSDTTPSATTTTSRLAWANCGQSPFANGVIFSSPGNRVITITDVNDASVSTSNPESVVVNRGRAYVQIHVNTNGTPDALPAGGVTVSVASAGHPGGTVTTSPAVVSVDYSTPYVVHSTAPPGYSVSYSFNSYNGAGKEVQVTTPSVDGTLDITFNYTSNVVLASWLGDYDPPSATPAGAGMGQWGQVHCGEAARLTGDCPSGSTTVIKHSSTACTSNFDCAVDTSNPTCDTNGFCSHTSGATSFVSLTNNLQPSSGRFQVSNMARNSGGHSLRFELKQGDIWNDSGARNELTREGDATSYGEGMEGFFTWSSWIDQLTFENPDPAHVNPFNTITQWHHAGSCASQPLGFGMNVQSKMLPSGGSNSVFGFGLSSTQIYLDPGCDSPTPVGGEYSKCTSTTPRFQSTTRNIWVANETQPALASGPALSGKWLDFILHVKYSATAGFIELWYRTDPAAPFAQQGLSCNRGDPFTAPRCNLSTLYRWPTQAERSSVWYLQGTDNVCYQDSTGQLAYGQPQRNDIQQGWYRHGGLQNTSVIYHDSMQQQAHFTDVLPAGTNCGCLRAWGDGTTTCQNDDQPCPF